MPNLEEHCQRTMKRYNVEGREIHSWLDEPCKKYAGSHRQFRHDSETVKLVGELFANTYGRNLSENIALDHIMADHEEEIKNRNATVSDTSDKPKNIEHISRAYEMEKLVIQRKKRTLRAELKEEIEYRGYTPYQRFRTLRLYQRLSSSGRPEIFEKRIQMLDKLVKEDFQNNPEFEKEFEERIETEKKIKQEKAAKTATKRIFAFFVSVLFPALVIGFYVHPLVGFLWFIFGSAFVAAIN